MKIFFQGGLEQYFLNKSDIEISEETIKSEKIRNLHDLIIFLITNYRACASSLFRKNNNKEGFYELSPGHLCFINDVDYEVLKMYDTDLNKNDSIYFISTMHGG
ncbi:hypothetical protein EDEG_02630 [Edhazardia aedis USNM 41457]|uniref:Ubiquitin-related modifier 1 n=1 Tax=Edhazardia aedis (strain USNM 41457) TaxID=1003232 RepID=J9D5A9_EDHAE|nr:hypothetical protein EDEG_02630 [Edhazardia aedis USNM 41457]|eukprot:EJW02986.1 hypothetical protein EDEG_02630 [Edhazardia aedis USNM 41457]